jgi:predicted RNA methylase
MGSSLHNRVKRALRRHGFLKFCWLAVYNLGFYLRHLPVREELDPVGRTFDAALGIETTAIREVSTLEIESSNLHDAVHYQPTGVDLTRRLFRELDIHHQDFVFIDFGCGKGRVMLLAAELPFRRILGVEFSPELHEIAERNIAASAGQLQGCRNVKAILADAAEFVPPDDPLVCYFYNPFGETVMREVLKNLESSLRKVPRAVWIIYVDPVHRKIFDESVWRVSNEEHPYVIYQPVVGRERRFHGMLRHGDAEV